MSLPRPEKAPFHTAVAQFQSGADSPRAFLERCLAAVDRFEPQVGAFVCMDIAAARAAADAASAAPNLNLSTTLVMTVDRGASMGSRLQPGRIRPVLQ